MVDAPAPLTYGTIIGTFISVLADSSDPGNTPDMIYLAGTVTITPTVRTLRIAGNPSYLAVQQSVVGKIVDGVLRAPDGISPLRLLATDSPGVSPTPFQYTAQFSLTGVSAQPDAITFDLPGGATVDLVSILPASPTIPVQTVIVSGEGIPNVVSDHGDYITISV